MIGTLFFIFDRLVEIVFLIPIIGMLAYFIDGFLKANIITPVYILVLFIVSVIAVFWCVDTMIRHATTKRSAIFVSFVDLLFFGAFIAGVYELRFIANANCGNWHGDGEYVSLGPFGLYGAQTGNPLANDLNKTCAMLKASFAMGIMEVIFFFWSALWALWIWRGQPRPVARKEVRTSSSRRRSHSSRRGHGSRARSSSRRPHYVV